MVAGAMKIVFHSPATNAAPWIAEIVNAFPAAQVWAWTPESADRQADYAVLWAPTSAFFDSQQHLKAIFNIGAGADGVLKLANLPPGVPIIRLNDAGMAVQMAEYVCHALFRFARGFKALEGNAAQSLWLPHPPIERKRFPVGVMGLGDIGSAVARAIVAFGYPVYGFSRSLHHVDGVTTYAGQENLAAFLSEVRVLVCLLPLTAETESILNADTFSKLKPQACLINVGRGKHLVEADLLSALASGQIASATLDVFREEPLPAGHPFWTDSNITVTPHIAAITVRRESVAQIATKIRALALGETVAGVVARDRGY